MTDRDDTGTVERAAAAVAMRDIPGPPNYAGSPPPRAQVRGVTPLGLPYPVPTDLLADAAGHVKALSDAVAVLLAAPGRNWGIDSQTSNANGDVTVPTAGLTKVRTYNMGAGTRQGQVGSMGYFYLFVLGGYWDTNTIWCRVFPGDGSGNGLVGILTEYAYSGSST